VEGLLLRDFPAFSVQFHPESAPGPHDARHFFEQFFEMVRRGRARASGH
jgi:carbamoyl-phosphate synthase small subunit